MDTREIIRIEELGKLYRLGQVGTGTLSHDVSRWWARIRGKEDPFAKVGTINDRTEGSTGREYVWGLRDINLSVQAGEIIGIIGKNGAGKSTLLKILSRITAPTTGSIRIRGRVASLLEIGTGFHPEMTGLENIYMNGTILGMRKREIDRKLEAIVEFAGIARYLDTPVKRYSSGMTVRLGFAVAAHLEPEILVVDEVLAVGDAAFQAQATRKMQEVNQKEGRTVLFVSHNIGSISRLCTRCCVLDKGGVDFMGPTPEAINRYTGNTSLQSVVKFDHPVVRSLRATVESGKMLLEIAYKDALGMRLSVGYVIADQFGNKLFGANPKHLSQEVPVLSTQEGVVRAEIVAPHLREGTYLLSIWVGDGYTDFFEAQDCLTIHIDDMRPLKIRMPQALVGPVIPQTQWIYEN